MCINQNVYHYFNFVRRQVEQFINLLAVGTSICIASSGHLGAQHYSA